LLFDNGIDPYIPERATIEILIGTQGQVSIENKSHYGRVETK
jgi:hypothetical protein